VRALNPKELKILHIDPDFGLIKQNRTFVGKFSGNQIQVDDYPSLKFIFFKFTAGGHGPEAKPPKPFNGVPLFLVCVSFI
jgi:hypothetical protein